MEKLAHPPHPPNQFSQIKIKNIWKSEFSDVRFCCLYFVESAKVREFTNNTWTLMRIPRGGGFPRRRIFSEKFSQIKMFHILFYKNCHHSRTEFMFIRNSKILEIFKNSKNISKAPMINRELFLEIPSQVQSGTAWYKQSVPKKCQKVSWKLVSQKKVSQKKCPKKSIPQKAQPDMLIAFGKDFSSKHLKSVNKTAISYTKGQEYF